MIRLRLRGNGYRDAATFDGLWSVRDHFERDEGPQPRAGHERYRLLDECRRIADVGVLVFPIGIRGGEPALLLGTYLAADLFLKPSSFGMVGAYAQRLCITGFGDIFGSANIFGSFNMPPKETEQFVKAEADKWPKFLRQAGIKAE